MAAVELATAYISLVPSALGITEKIGEEMGAPLIAAATKSGNDSGAAFAKAIKGLIGPAIVAGAVGGLAAIGGSFDSAFSTLRVKTGATGKDLGGLKDTFKDVVSSVPASFGDASTAVSELAVGLGLSGDNLGDLSKQVLDLSHITKTDLGGNVKSVSGLFNSWNVATADQGSSLDELFRISQKTGVSVADLATGVTDSGVQFRAVGFDLRGSASLLGLLGKNGLAAADIMPAISKSMAVAAKEGKPAAEVFGQTWAAIRDAPDATTAAGLAIDVFGAKAGPKFAALIREGKLSYEGLVDQVVTGGDTIRGAASDTAAWHEKLTLLKNKALLVLAPIAAKVFGAIASAIDGVKPTWLWLQDHKPILVGVAIVLGSVLVAALVALTTAAWAALAPILVFAAPFIAVGAAIGALAAGVIWAYQNLGFFKAAVDAVRDAILWVWHNVLEPVIDWLSGHFVDLLKVVGEVLLAALTGGISEIFLRWDEITQFFKELPGKIIGFLTGLPSLLIDLGKKLMTGLLDGIVWVAENVLFQYFIGIPLKILEWVKDANLWLIGKGKDLLLGLLHGIEDGVSTIFTWFFNLPGMIKDWVVDAGKWLFDAGKAVGRGFWEGIKAAWNSLADIATFKLPKVHIPGTDIDFGGNTISLLPHLALGGSLGAGMPAIVGERGPELWVPKTAGTVVPNGQFGGGGINLTINTVAGNPQELWRVLEPVLRNYNVI